MNPRKVDLVAQAKTPEGVKEYNFLALKRKDAMRVYHNSLVSVAKIVGDAVSSLNIDRANFAKSKIDIAKGAGNLLSGIAGVHFDTLWDIATVLFRGAILDGEEIRNLEESDYFDTRPEEFYIALYHAIRLNYPLVFSQVQKVTTLLEKTDLLDGEEGSGLKAVTEMMTSQGQSSSPEQA
jgi:hypothetical protein